METMKRFTGLLFSFGFGFILCMGHPNNSTGNLLPKNDTKESNFAGIIYNAVGKSFNDDEDFVISPLGVADVLGALLVAVGPTSAIEIGDLLFPKHGLHLDLGARPSVLPLPSSKLQKHTMVVVNEDMQLEPELVENFREMETVIHKIPTNKLVFSNILTFRAPFATKFVHTNEMFFIPKKGPTAPKQSAIKARRAKVLRGHFSELRTQVVGLPFQNSKEYLLILIPSDLKYLESKLPTVDIRKFRRRLNATRLDVLMPQVVLKNRLNLKETLIYLGIENVFNNKTADLDGFKRSLPLDEVVVETQVRFSLGGINWEFDSDDNAAVIPEKGSSGGPNPLFGIRTPFIYAILDSHHVYLMGRFGLSGTLKEGPAKRPKESFGTVIPFLK